MKITYDLEFLPERRRPKDGEDLLALKAFLAGKYENMCIQYEDEALCKRRYDSLRAFRTAHQQQEYQQSESSPALSASAGGGICLISPAPAPCVLSSASVFHVCLPFAFCARFWISR